MTHETEHAMLSALKLLLDRTCGKSDNAEGSEVRERLDKAIQELERQCPICRHTVGHADDCPNLP